jgi:signal transduction histidine kinase
VNRLARGQERELRAWLYGPGGYGRPGHDGADRPADELLSVALGTAAGEVEDTYAVTVNPVVVGDATMVPDLRALVLAAREAMVNAAKHAGVEDIDVYAEVDRDGTDGVVDVFVRDRGAGFDPDAVGPDRHGLADSIRNRMERHGGTVRLKTAPGEGTEIRLTMPLDDGESVGGAAGAVTREGER